MFNATLNQAGARPASGMGEKTCRAVVNTHRRYLIGQKISWPLAGDPPLLDNDFLELGKGCDWYSVTFVEQDYFITNTNTYSSAVMIFCWKLLL